MKLEKYLNESTSGKEAKAISDLGKSLDITDNNTGKKVGKLPRYAVWGYDPEDPRKDTVIDTGDNLPKLLKKWKLEKSDVIKIK